MLSYNLSSDGQLHITNDVQHVSINHNETRFSVTYDGESVTLFNAADPVFAVACEDIDVIPWLFSTMYNRMVDTTALEVSMPPSKATGSPRLSFIYNENKMTTVETDTYNDTLRISLGSRSLGVYFKLAEQALDDDNYDPDVVIGAGANFPCAIGVRHGEGQYLKLSQCFAPMAVQLLAHNQCAGSSTTIKLDARDLLAITKLFVSIKTVVPQLKTVNGR